MTLTATSDRLWASSRSSTRPCEIGGHAAEGCQIPLGPLIDWLEHDRGTLAPNKHGIALEPEFLQ
jgi:hypothetical protein